MPEQLIIRALEPTDLPAAEQVHIAAFPSSALTRLGPGCVRRYYEWQLLGPHQVTALGAFEGDRVVGYCIGGVFQGAMAGFLRKNRAFLAWRIVTRPWLLANPIVRERISRAFHSMAKRRRSPASRGGAHDRARTSFGILSIAVDPHYQGRGVGKLLMNASEAVARQGGFQAMDLTVDPANTPGIAFYTRLQWQKLQTGSRWTGTMRKSLIA